MKTSENRLMPESDAECAVLRKLIATSGLTSRTYPVIGSNEFECQFALNTGSTAGNDDGFFAISLVIRRRHFTITQIFDGDVIPGRAWVEYQPRRKEVDGIISMWILDNSEQHSSEIGYGPVVVYPPR